jgi:predicted MFS family arabinose efflux permease
MVKDVDVSSYRWVMLFLCVLAIVAQAFMWLSPAPILANIIAELKISLGQAGTLLTVITLMWGIFTLSGSFLIDKLGLKATMITSLVVFALGGMASYFAHSFAAIFIARLVVGVGLGPVLPTVGAVVMSWFPPNERPYINSVVMVSAYVGLTLAYMLAVPVFKLVGTWQNTLAVFGASIIVVALLWAIFGKVRTSEESGSGIQSAAQKNQTLEKKESGLAQAANRKEVWLVLAMMTGQMWTFNTFTTYLPVYFQQIRGLDAAAAGAIAGILPLAGIFGAVVCGVTTGALGLRKPFTWPFFVFMLLGAIGSISISPGPLLYLAVGIMGFAVAGFTVVFLQIPMDLEGTTPEMVGGAIAIIMGSSYIISYFSPMVFGLLEPKLGIATTMIVLGCSLIVSIIAGLMMRETGPAANKPLPAVSR